MTKSVILDTRAKLSRAQGVFTENFEDYFDGKIFKEQFSQNAIPLRENIKKLEAEECEQSQAMAVMDAKMDLCKEWTRHLREFQKTGVLTAEIVDAFVEKVTVDTSKHIFVKYSFKELDF